jgi:thiol-disulfide isomerase/thioredoxin
VLRSGSKQPAPWDLGRVVGRRPLVICYLATGEPKGEETLLQLQARMKGGWAGKVEALGAVRFGDAAAAEVAARMSLLGIDLPVILDDGFALGRKLGTTTSPSLTLVDRSGVLKVADARSLKQEALPGTRIADLVDKAARGEPVPTIARLERYYPVTELVGESYPDFMLKQFQGTARVKLSDRFTPGAKKIVAVLFWHPNCPHCKKLMPGIVSGYETYKEFVDLVSVVALKDGAESRNAADTIRNHKMTFPVLEDEGRRIHEIYKIVSTPTMIFIRPDGVVDSAYTNGDVNYLPVFSAKLRSILGQPSRLRGSRPSTAPSPPATPTPGKAP